MEPDGSIRIEWRADGFEAIHVRAPFWPNRQLAAFAASVADVALTNRTVSDLARQLRDALPGQFNLQATDEDASDRRVLVIFHPPPGQPNPDDG
jgi:hypothetical protein